MRFKKQNGEFDIVDSSAAPKLFEMNRLKKGDVIKVGCLTEVFNVQLTKVIGEMCEGCLPDTTLFPTMHGLDKGDNIRFMKKHVYAIVEKWID